LRISTALAIYRMRVRKYWLQELLAIVGIAAGVGLLYATQVASTSLSAPVRQLTAGIVGNSQLQVVARGAQPFSEDLYQKIIALPGVARAAPVLQVPANVTARGRQHDLTLFGADPRIVQLRGQLLKGLTSSDAAQQEAVVLTTPIAEAIGATFGSDVQLQIAGRTFIEPVVIADRRQVGALVDTSMALVPLAFLQRLTGVGHRVTRILVEARPGSVADVRRELQALKVAGTDVRPANYETTLFDEAAGPTTQASAIFSVVSALVGWLFAACALLVTADRRRDLAAQQHEQGYLPSATLKMLMIDVVVVGFVGSALGLVAGEALSRQGFQSDVGFLSGAFPIGDQRVVTWQSVAVAVGGGFLAAAIGILAPVWRIVLDSLPGPFARADVHRRHRESSQDRPARRRLGPLCGVACLTGAAAITIAAPRAAVVGLILLLAAMTLLLPSILAGAIGLLSWANSRGTRSSAALSIALQQLRARRWRTRALAITITGAIAVLGATSLQGARTNLQAGLDSVSIGLDDVASVWAAPAGAGSLFATTPFRPGAQNKLAHVPGVRRVSLYRGGLLDVADRRAWVLGVPAASPPALPPGQILEGDTGLANARIHAGGWAAISRALADDLHLTIGDRLTLPSPNPIVVRVAAIITNLGWPGGAVVLDAPDLTRAWGNDAIAAYQLQTEPGTTPEQARDRVAAALGSRSGLRVETADQRAGRQEAASRDGLSRLRQIAWLTVVAAMLAVAAAMIGLLWQHRRDIAWLDEEGCGRGLLWSSLAIEVLVLIGAGAIPAGVLALLGQVLCTRGVQVVTGFPVAGGIRPELAVSTVALVLGTSLIVVAIAGYRVVSSSHVRHE
jgi:putative ABC transport system permease protein